MKLINNMVALVGAISLARIVQKFVQKIARAYRRASQLEGHLEAIALVSELMEREGSSSREQLLMAILRAKEHDDPDVRKLAVRICNSLDINAKVRGR